MDIIEFTKIIDADFYVGVPDSQLKALCNYLMDSYGIDSKHHIIAANEGNCVAMAAGYYLATGKIPVVYMQNSGEGNTINPVASLLSRKVYAIPMIFIVGWRGEPGVKDEPQHIYQGEITIRLLEDMEISTFILDKDTREEEIRNVMVDFRKKLQEGKNVAFVIRKGSLIYERERIYKNENVMTREKVIEHIVKYSGEDPIVSTTGKASRELFELRERNRQEHKYDFLTVGSMGHCSSIALGIALHQPNKRIWCIDGDGAMLMHMGALVVIGANAPKNLIHIVINNGAHETVGGMPTVARGIELSEIAKVCGYPRTFCVGDYRDLDLALKQARVIGELCMIEIKCSLEARDNLGRPGRTPLQIKEDFMEYLRE